MAAISTSCPSRETEKTASSTHPSFPRSQVTQASAWGYHKEPAVKANAAACDWRGGPAVKPGDDVAALRRRYHGPHPAGRPADVGLLLGSPEEENAAAARIIISDDLVASARAQVKFLAAVEGAKQLHAPENALKIVRRYARFWLPLVAKYGESTELMPPLDIEWAWHCHLLNPLAYRADCEQLAGRVLDHCAIIKDKAMALGTAMSLWASEYPGEPWTLSDSSAPASATELSATESYVLGAMSRQKKFYGEVCANEPRINETAYLENALERYRKFLHLGYKTRDTDMSITPTRDVDLMWHAHQRSPLAYAADCIALMGHVIGHDDTYDPEADDFEAFFAVADVWRTVYGDAYDTSAGGEPAKAPDAVACRSRCIFYALGSDAPRSSDKKTSAAVCSPCRRGRAVQKPAAVSTKKVPSAAVCSPCRRVVQKPAVVPCSGGGCAHAAAASKRPAAVPCGSRLLC